MEYTEIFEGVVGLILTMAIYFVTAYFRAKTAAIKDEQARQQAEMIVKSVEQTTSAMEKETKYEKAFLALRKKLEDKKIPFDDDMIDDLIESAVFTYTNKT